MKGPLDRGPQLISNDHSMENLAHAFDKPIGSREHQDLAGTAWMGGEAVSVRYWLGRLLCRNFFRESDDDVKEALQKYLIAHGCDKGSTLAYNYESWSSLAIALQHQFELREGSNPNKNRRLPAAIWGVLVDPDATDAQLAAHSKTTEKQIARMTDVLVLRKLWKKRRC